MLVLSILLRIGVLRLEVVTDGEVVVDVVPSGLFASLF